LWNLDIPPNTPYNGDSRPRFTAKNDPTKNDPVCIKLYTPQPERSETMQVHFILKSSNGKTGAIPVTYTQRGSCPDECPLQGDGGCYAEDYFTRMTWDKVDSGKLGASWDTLTDKVQALPLNQLWRHNVGGDLPKQTPATTLSTATTTAPAPSMIDTEKLGTLVAANKGKRGFTYTHYPDTEHNIAAIRHANDNGFTINLSANDLDHAVRLAKHGLPMTTLVPVDWGTKTVMYGGLRIVPCPATYRDGVTCGTCELCAVSKRDCVVAFPAHGSRKNKVTAQIIARSGTGQAA
jgi:hypothetical protein